MQTPTHDNDNTDTWISLAAATANVVRWLEGTEQKKEDAQRDAEQNTENDKKRDEQRAYIEQRLRDLTAFENRFNPGYRSRRK
jgi:uncharacterized membrane protein YqiK